MISAPDESQPVMQAHKIAQQDSRNHADAKIKKKLKKPAKPLDNEQRAADSTAHC